MSNTTQAQVMALLESYLDTIRKIAVYRYELEHLACVTPDEVIGSMNFTHNDGIGSVTGHISNKTAYIAMHYQEKANELTEDATGKLAAVLWDMEQERDRLHFYVSLLPPRQRKVIRLHYFAGKTREEVCGLLKISSSTYDKNRKKGVELLCGMYADASAVKKA